MRTHIVAAWAIVLLVAIGTLIACSKPTTPQATQPSQEEQPTAQSPVTADGATLLQERCTACHTLSRVEQAKHTRAEWEQTVARMVGKGAKLSADEQTTLIDYLAETYKP